jgi:hypothetical protein
MKTEAEKLEEQDAEILAAIATRRKLASDLRTSERNPVHRGSVDIVRLSLSEVRHIPLHL